MPIWQHVGWPDPSSSTVFGIFRDDGAKGPPPALSDQHVYLRDKNKPNGSLARIERSKPIICNHDGSKFSFSLTVTGITEAKMGEGIVLLSPPEVAWLAQEVGMDLASNRPFSELMSALTKTALTSPVDPGN